MAQQPPQARPVSPEALASAAMSVATALGQMLVLKGVATKEELIDLYKNTATAKGAKAFAYQDEAEAEASDVLLYLADRLIEKL